MGITGDLMLGAAVLALSPIWAPVLGARYCLDKLDCVLSKKPKKRAAALDKAFEQWQANRVSGFNWTSWKYYYDGKLCKALPGFDADNYNFAFVGNVKSGKSALVNSVRGLPDTLVEDANNRICDNKGIARMGRARVGFVETTMDTSRYSFGNACENAVVWDVPGSGTQSHRAETYYKDKALYAFDCLILVTSGAAAGEADVALMKAASEMGQPFAIVRTKCDLDAQTLIDACMDPAEAVRMVREEVTMSLQKELAAAGLTRTPPIFLVNRKAFNGFQGMPSSLRFDEDKLLEWLAAVAKQRHEA
ncbi:hypothetical protein HYH03_006421 [Edaphochlamys debaryana]|uniref:IRG-type G domain-containing protein n=1 Tax=Edaphochlamys debaryana TaxID=47281 RepID=A0A836C062_9CHLO|nr:hypothetical protein HYH03_006421 [Edaphochlamys debaryana]|eukprot:KAG2495476.1 hypothetical protein HYH03_006421 [Edaphochlamys debaryana]